MATAEKLAEIAKRARDMQETISELNLLHESMPKSGFYIVADRNYLFSENSKFNLKLRHEIQALIVLEIDLREKELENLSKPEYIAELLKEN